VDRLITVPLAEHERAALISWTYNVGEGALRAQHPAPAAQHWRPGGAANEFRRWNQAGGRVLAGLTRRRADEEALFRGNYQATLEGSAMSHNETCLSQMGVRLKTSAPIFS
jgi:GH24 family phage-related lysozyme (muramidase)